MTNEMLGLWADHFADDVDRDIKERLAENGCFELCLTCERDCKMVKCNGVDMKCFGYRGKI